MIVKTLLAAIVAGLIAGVFMTSAQEMRVVPLILHAEDYEGQEPGAPPAGGTVHQHSGIAPAGWIERAVGSLQPVTPAYAHDMGDHEEGGIMFGMSRFSGTLIANLVAGAGFGLLLAGVGLLVGRPVTASNGIVWGALGWLTVHMLPAIGLPPELPGFPAADLGDRQTWWLGTVAASAIGLYLVSIRPETLAKAFGLLVIALPHIYGAPQPSDIASPVPAVLGAEFAVAALATTLAFWLFLGLLSGWINDRTLKAA